MRVYEMYRLCIITNRRLNLVKVLFDFLYSVPVKQVNSFSKRIKRTITMLKEVQIRGRYEEQWKMVTTHVCFA